MGSYHPQCLAEAGRDGGLLRFQRAEIREGQWDGKSVGARKFRWSPRPEKVVVVDEQRPAVLAMGGPLTNSISVTRHGRDLKFTYRLIGAGGGDYKLWEYWRRRDSPPQFAIDRWERKIGSGKFEFG